MSARSRRALYLTNRREVTTTSAAAYEAYQEGVANERRFYMKDAQVDYAKALSLDPNFAMAMLRLAGHSNREQAVSLIDRAARLRGRLNERERLYVDMAQGQMSGNPEARDKAAQTIRERYPEDVDAAMVLAGKEMAKGNADRALQIYSELIAIDPNNAGVYNQIGYYYAWRGDYEKAMENLKKTLEAAGCGMKDLVSATRYLTDVGEQDDLNRVWAEYLGGHLPTTTTVEVSRLATHRNCKIEISAIAVADSAPRHKPRKRRRGVRT